eukprot:CAMPEP_0201935574 /NCGR_PEP_ID=MMETSP0903-20130614/35771_1 /ASSEMBLY_ACC=CAM_ASM_000552 /TAXON_ID=420261 /ORGANISM="Thalassiosira antarctica, Strain CCMP982" /LENGTH=126 /DNA_ID=CAMNT_0048476027 /DNA_START=236 /DNA_END=617 /DNA_ORIENTATION=+
MPPPMRRFKKSTRKVMAYRKTTPHDYIQITLVMGNDLSAGKFSDWTYTHTAISSLPWEESHSLDVLLDCLRISEAFWNTRRHSEHLTSSSASFSLNELTSSSTTSIELVGHNGIDSSINLSESTWP